MVSVRLNFVPPSVPDIASLHIYEAPSSGGPWTEIEQVPVTPPDYISEYTTDKAASVNDWFAIDWYDAKGGHLGISAPVQGGTEYLVGELIERVMLRDPSLDENVIRQEAEAVVQLYYNADPYTLLVSDASYIELSGLTLLTLARCWIFQLASGATQSYVAGLVSQTSSSQQQQSKNIADLLKAAERMLGLSGSRILQLAEVDIAGGTATTTLPDESRLLVEIL